MNITETPNWYWKNGLHDAVIETISLEQLNYDYTQRVPIRNYLSIKLNAQNALFDVSVKEIKLYNAKVMSDAFDYSGYWWVNDSLKIQNEKYVLNIQIANIKKEETIIVIIDNAEVFRS